MRKISLLAVALLVAACGSVGLGDLGTILGSPSSTQASDVQATVNSVDTQAQRIDVNVNYVNNLRNTQGSTQSIYYDSHTQVVFQGNKNYRPEDLERGDEISVRGSNVNGRYVADTITVTRNVRG
jgi:hypothetical protein